MLQTYLLRTRHQHVQNIHPALGNAELLWKLMGLLYRHTSKYWAFVCEFGQASSEILTLHLIYMK